jgi:xanthine dehydrogenase YagR molybdenum-binding subunit
MNAIGEPLTRVDGPAKVTGRARYAAEFHPDGLAYAATHDSTVPAGRITAIDTAAAEHAPGVLLVLTHLNADRLSYQAPTERPAVDPVAGEQLRVLQDAESGSAASQSRWWWPPRRRRRFTRRRSSA